MLCVQVVGQMALSIIEACLGQCIIALGIIVLGGIP